MAITVIQAPGGAAFSSTFYNAHTPLWFVVSSSNIAQPDFRFVFDIRSTGGVLLARLKITPDALGHGIVDVSRVVQTLINNYFDPRNSTYSPFTISTNEITARYIVQFGEEYGGVIHAALSQDNYYAYNAYTTDTPGNAPFTEAAQYAHLWATDRGVNDLVDNRNNVIYMPRNGRTFLSYLNDPEEDLTVYVSYFYDIGVTGPVGSTPAITGLDKLVVINLNLEYLNAGPFTPASPLAADADGYHITLVRGDGTTASPDITVRWMCEGKTPATTIHFLNKLGAFDTYHFAGPTRRSLDMERKEYETLVKTTDYNSNLVYFEKVIPFNSKQTWSRKLSSGYVSDETHLWLSQLVASPQVYLEEGGYCYPVVIRTNRWTEKLSRFDKLYNLELDIEMGRRINSQSR